MTQMPHKPQELKLQHSAIRMCHDKNIHWQIGVDLGVFPHQDGQLVHMMKSEGNLNDHETSSCFVRENNASWTTIKLIDDVQPKLTPVDETKWTIDGP